MSLVSDEFNGPIDAAWTFVAPVAGPTYDENVGDLGINVPSGVDYDAYTPSIRAPQMLQSTADVDFQVEIKIDDRPDFRFQIAGIIAKFATTNYLRFDLYHNGTDLKIFSATIAGGLATNHFNTTIVGVVDGHRLRLTRMGDDWTCEESADSITWNIAGSFTHAMTVSQVGIFAGSTDSPASGAPGFGANFDYFRVTATGGSVACDVTGVGASGVGSGVARLGVPCAVEGVGSSGVAVASGRVTVACNVVGLGSPSAGSGVARLGVPCDVVGVGVAGEAAMICTVDGISPATELTGISGTHAAATSNYSGTHAAATSNYSGSIS